MLRQLINRLVGFFNTTKRAQRQHMKEWIAALRSGKYKQTKYDLKNANGFCCLGVGCDISGLGKWNESPNMRARYVTSESLEENRLPADVAAYFGVAQNPVVFRDDQYGGYDVLATQANDARGLTFAEIADKLEERYL